MFDPGRNIRDFQMSSEVLSASSSYHTLREQQWHIPMPSYIKTINIHKSWACDTVWGDISSSRNSSGQNVDPPLVYHCWKWWAALLPWFAGEFTQTKHNTQGTCKSPKSPPFRINVSIDGTFRAERTHITSRARNYCVILGFSYMWLCMERKLQKNS